MKNKTQWLPLVAVALIATSANAGWEEGVAAFQAGKYQTAAKEFQAVAEGQPEWPGGHLMMGRALLKLDRPQEAAVALKKAYDLDPNDVGAKISLAQAYLAANRPGDASQLLRTVDAGGLNAQQKAAYNQLTAAAYSGSGQTEQAAAALRQAVAANPNDADLQHQYGSLALQSGDTSNAVNALKKAVSLAPSDNAKRKALVGALIRLGRESQGSAKTTAYRDAIEAAKVLARDGSFDHLLTLGEAQMGAKNYSDAVGTFQSAAAKSSGDWLPLYYIGQSQTSLGQYDSAEQNLNNALQKASSNKDKTLVWKQLAFVYEKQKKFDDAIAAYNRVGDSAGAARAQKNKDIAEENQRIEEENQLIQQLQDEAEALQNEIENLPPGL